MAFALIGSSGLQKGANLTWTHTFTLNNLCTAQTQNDSANNSAAADFKDSSGTPKNLTLDVSVNSSTQAAVGIFSLVVPSGFTSPLKGPANFQEWMACEWSGNATSSVLDTSNTQAVTMALSQTSVTGPTINTGANAGLVLTALSLNTTVNGTSNGQAAQAITVTGTSFTDTYSTSHDGTDSNNSTSDGGTLNYRTATCASQTGLGDSWTFSAANNAGFGDREANVIASYNEPVATVYLPPIDPIYVHRRT